MRPISLDRRIELTLIPSFDYLYGFTGILELTSSHIEKLGNFDKKQERQSEAKGLPDWTVFLTFPLVEYGSALNQIVLAHELAHFLIHLENLPSKVQEFTLHGESFSQLLENVRNSPLRHFNRPLSSVEEVEQHSYEVCSEMVKSWMQEVMADLIAVHCLGPSYHFAFVEFLANSSVDDVPDRIHPAPSYRCCRVLDELSFLGYSDSSTGVSDSLWNSKPALESAAKSSVDRYEGAERVAHATIEEKLQEIVELVREFCQRFSYRASKYNAEVPPLVNRLIQGLVPMNGYEENQQLCPLSPVAILNAGTEVYATKWPEFQSLFTPDRDRTSNLQNLNGLLFKSLELNEVIRRFYS